MHRGKRIKSLATKRGMRNAHRIAQMRRGGNDHTIVLGGLRMIDGRIILKCVECGPAFNILRPIRLTDDATRFYRWRTRQAADQFQKLWGLVDVHTYDLDFMDVLAEPSPRKTI